MENCKPFFDLCVSDKCVNADFSRFLKTFYDHGYRTIAITRFFTEDTVEQRKKKKKGEPKQNTDVIPKPNTIPHVEGCEQLKIIHRLTIIFSDQSTIHKVMKCDNIKKYDIIAVLPLNQSAFQYACGNVEADIITFDPECKNPIKFNRKMYNLAVDRGMYFELMYGPALYDSTLRKNIIQTSHLYHTHGKSKNIIITSWGINTSGIRGPYDIINLGLILGLSEGDAKNAITLNCKKLLLRAAGRRMGKVIMVVETLKTNQQDLEVMTIDDSDETNESDEADEEMNGQPVQKKKKQ